MKRTPLKRLGKKGLAWEKIRRDLKARFQRAGITTCELQWPACWNDNGLGFAHAKKRRNLKAGELSVVALLCNGCHEAIEILPEHEMERLVMAVIAGRTQYQKERI